MKVRHDRYDPRFLAHMIYGGPPSHRIKVASQGSTVGHFNMDDIAALTILAPPLDEQVSIVDHIAEATERIEQAEQYARSEIDLLREWNTRLIADVVTGKLDVREAADRLPDETDEPEPVDEIDVEESEDVDIESMEPEPVEA